MKEMTVLKHLLDTVKTVQSKHGFETKCKCKECDFEFYIRWSGEPDVSFGTDLDIKMLGHAVMHIFKTTV